MRTRALPIGKRVPAFLSEVHRGLESSKCSTSSYAPRWTPGVNTRKVLKVVEALPKLTAQIGLAASHPEADVEILPGSPCTIVFTSKGKLKGMVVLPGDTNHLNSLLGIPPITTSDIVADQLWEEHRQDDQHLIDDQLTAPQDW